MKCALPLLLLSLAAFAQTGKQRKPLTNDDAAQHDATDFVRDLRGARATQFGPAFGFASGTFPARDAVGKTIRFSAWIKTDGLGSGATSGARLTLDFRPGGINAWRPSDVISGTSDWQLYQVGPIVVETDRTAAVWLENYGGASGTAWFDDVSLVQILPPPVDVFLLYPNYRGLLFDDQPQTIRLDVTVTPPGGGRRWHSPQTCT